MKKSSSDFVIKVHELMDLVVAPKSDPFSDYKPECQAQTAIALAIRQWDTKGRYPFSMLTIHMPSSKLKALDEEKARLMLKGYFEERLEDNKESLYLFRKKIARTFRNAFVFLGCCMGIVSMINTPTLMPPMPIFRGVLTEGLTVIGWVVFRTPVELVLYDLHLFRSKKAIYQQFLNAKVRFVADDSF